MTLLNDPISESYERILNENFLTERLISFLDRNATGWKYNKETGLVDCYSFSLRGSDYRKLPVRFGRCEGDFYCVGNMLTTLEGSPSYVGGDFNCSHNLLKSLEHGPTTIEDGYYCIGNMLTTLKGCPRIIPGDFDCSSNPLSSLDILPDSIRHDFYCTKSQLTLKDLYPLINKVAGYIFFGGNIYTTKDLIRMKYLNSGIEEV